MISDSGRPGGSQSPGGNDDEPVVWLAAGDILNDRGQVLLKQGSVISPQLFKRLKRQSLKVPIEASVRTCEPFTAERLSQSLQDFLQRHDDLGSIHQNSGYQETLDFIYRRFGLPDGVASMLTALAESLPEVFERSLFCAWLGSMLARKMNLKPRQVYNAFLIGVLHDLGMLHVPRSLIGRHAAFEPHEWRIISAHTELAVLLLREQVLFDNELVEAVAHHHERCDGTGYPQGLTGSELSPLSQVVGICDLLHGVWSRQLVPQGKSIADAESFLSINSHAYFYNTYAALVSLIKTTEQRSGHKCTDAAPGCCCKDGLLAINREFRLLHSLLQGLSRQASKSSSAHHAEVLETLYSNVHNFMSSSGLGSEFVEYSLAGPADEKDSPALLDMCEVRALMEEALWIFKRAHRLIPDMIGASRGAGDAHLLMDIYQMMELSLSRCEAARKITTG